MRKDGFNLVGLATTPVGLGEDLRMFAGMLDTLGIPYSVRALMDHRRAMRQVHAPFRFMCEDHFEISLFFLSAFATLEVKKAHPQLFEDQRLTIGYWPWELPHFPQDQLDALECTDMIWCPSHFVRDSYCQSTAKPITVLPLPTALAPPSTRDFRQQLGIPSSDFVVLYAYDAASTTARKNPLGTVRAFCEFAATHEDAWLILKCHRLSPDEARHYSTWLDHPRVIVFEESLDVPDMAALYADADCYLSLHRSEGFGRTLVEALQAGLPVVTTEFSAPGEFLTAETAWFVKWSPVAVKEDDFPFAPATGSWWAEPDVEDAARQLERVYQDRHCIHHQRLKRAGQEFSVEKLAAQYEPVFNACLQPQSREILAAALASLRAGGNACPPAPASLD